MKRILIITYYWPPSGGSGVQRWMYFCRYLSDFGYHPIVLTVSENNASYKNIDKSFVEKVKDIETHKTKTFEPLKLYSFLTTGSSKKGIPQGNVETKKTEILKTIFTFIRGNFFIPDARVGWNSHALKKARKIIEQERPEMIITTGPPQSTHLIGLQLKKEYSIKWVADFRDPWTELYYNKDMMRTNWAKKKDELLEKEVLESADRVLTVGFKLKELLQKKVPSNQDKFHHIYNGYDSFLFKEIQVETHDHFEITFIGLLTKKQPYMAIIESVKKFLGIIPNANIQLCLCGNIENEILEAFKRELLTVKIDIQGYVDHKTALKFMKRSQLLLNPLPVMEGSDILITGKQMEYIATGNPILCIGNTKSESAIILKNVVNGRFFEKEQIDEISEFLLYVYQKWERNEPYLNDVDSESITSKSRFETSRQLAQFLNDLNI